LGRLYIDVMFKHYSLIMRSQSNGSKDEYFFCKIATIRRTPPETNWMYALGM
jgi:hypothetical protein